MTTPLDLSGFPSAIYDRHFVEWNKINNTYNNLLSKFNKKYLIYESYLKVICLLQKSLT